MGMDIQNSQSQTQNYDASKNQIDSAIQKGTYSLDKSSAYAASQAQDSYQKLDKGDLNVDSAKAFLDDISALGSALDLSSDEAAALQQAAENVLRSKDIDIASELQPFGKQTDSQQTDLTHQRQSNKQTGGGDGRVQTT